MSANEGTLENSELPENKKKRQEDPIEEDSDAPGSLGSREDEVEEAGTSSRVVRPEPRYGLVINPISGQAGASEVTRPLDMYHYGNNSMNPVDYLGPLTVLNSGHAGLPNPYQSLISQVLSAQAGPPEDLQRQILSLASPNRLLNPYPHPNKSTMQDIHNAVNSIRGNAPAQVLPRDSEALGTNHVRDFLKNPAKYLADPSFTQKLTKMLEKAAREMDRGSNQDASSSLDPEEKHWDTSGTVERDYNLKEFEAFVLGLNYKPPSQPVSKPDRKPDRSPDKKSDNKPAHKPNKKPTKTMMKEEKDFLEKIFEKYAYPNHEECQMIGKELGYDASPVQTWFKNNRRNRSYQLRNLLKSAGIITGNSNLLSRI